MLPSKIIINHNTELIKVSIINLHPVVTNSSNIVDSVYGVRNKEPNKIIMKSVDIGKRNLAKSSEENINGCGKEAECFIVEENIQCNLQYHEQRVDNIYYFGCEISHPICMRSL